MKAQSSPPAVRALRGPFVRLLLLAAGLLLGTAALAQKPAAPGDPGAAPPNYPGASTPLSGNGVCSGPGPLNVPVLGSSSNSIFEPSNYNYYAGGFPNGGTFYSGGGVDFYWTQNTDQLFYATYLSVWTYPQYKLVFSKMVVDNTDYYSADGYFLTAAISGSGIVASPKSWYDYSFYVPSGICDNFASGGLTQEYIYELESYLIVPGDSNVPLTITGHASGTYYIQYDFPNGRG